MKDMRGYNFHGDPDRFPVLVDLIDERFDNDLRYVADVAGGQGMLSKLLKKRLNLDSEVIDPRGHRIRGVAGHEQMFKAESASYYDLVVGLHPDQATQEIVKSALVTKTILVPCCNYWDRRERLGTLDLLLAIEDFYKKHGVHAERVELDFRRPKNVAFVTLPPRRHIDLNSIVLPPLDIPSPDKREDWLTEKKRQTTHP
jgi:hypothetical protein